MSTSIIVERDGAAAPHWWRESGEMRRPEQPEELLLKMIAGSFVSQALYVAARLGVADLLAEEARDARALADATGAHAGSLYRVLRALASVGVFCERADGKFELNAAARLLRRDAEGSLRDTAIMFGEEWHWRVWGSAYDSVRTGEPAFAGVHGSDIFPYFAANQDAACVFDRAMTSLSHTAAAAVSEAYDFSGVTTLADIAGGHGTLLAGILRANPSMRGVLFDQPQVIAGAPERLAAEGVEGRVELKTGDFFAEVPAGADAYLMKYIIHDWDDERAHVILANCRRAMPDGARLLLVETVIAEGNAPHFGKLLDLEMLLFTGGRERTEAEYRALLARAGFRLTRVVPTRSPLSIVEAVKDESAGN
jgi:hypothetical protein